MLFHDRVDAGRKLATLLQGFRDSNPLVIAIPRGGVPVGYEVARALGAPLDVIVVRKLGAPDQPELGVGAIAEGGALWADATLLRELEVSPHELRAIAEREAMELDRRVRLYRGTRTLPDLSGRTVILVDDGVARGGTARAAIRAIREQHPKSVVLAIPVIAADTARELRGLVDEIVFVHAPEVFYAVGAWYEVFAQTRDEEVCSLLEQAQRSSLSGRPPPPAPPASADDPEQAAIACDGGTLQGVLELPRAFHGVVIFAHGSGSSRHSPRNQHVARRLRDCGLATLLLDLLTRDEEDEDELTGRLRFDVERLAQRLVAAAQWALQRPSVRGLPIGLFGASTGAAAALIAAARQPQAIRAVVSRGGRPDLAGGANLARVRAPTLLIVGGRDPEVLQLNRDALGQIGAERRLVVVPGATHLFEEAGALDTVARLAAGWFNEHLHAGDSPAAPPPA